MKDFQTRDLLGSRVLVVDDNEMNQLIVFKALEHWNAFVDRAESGESAIAKLKQKRYDIILMDVQMPDMNGYEVTKYIRSNFSSPQNEVPILAITAGANLDESARCIASGMNDFIGKPFDLVDLYSKIAQILNINQPSDHTPSNDFPVTNLSYLKMLALGDKNFERNMITLFLTQSPEYIESLKHYSERKQWQPLKTLAHKMKPTIAFVGSKELEDIIGTIEIYAAEHKNLYEIPNLIDRAAILCNKACIELETNLNSLPK